MGYPVLGYVEREDACGRRSGPALLTAVQPSNAAGRGLERISPRLLPCPQVGRWTGPDELPEVADHVRLVGVAGQSRQPVRVPAGAAAARTGSPAPRASA